MTSLERLGYCHSVPLGQEDLLILLGALSLHFAQQILRIGWFRSRPRLFTM